MEIIYDQFIGVYNNFHSEEFCNSLINTYENSTEKEDRQLYAGGNKLKFSDTSVSLNDEEGKPLESVKSQLDIFNENLKLAYEDYHRKYPITPSKFEIYDYKLQKTLPTEGFHMWHAEFPKSFNPNSLDLVSRFLVYTLYLNDVEEGGETEFLYQSKRISPKAGTLCLFPAYFTHTHRGNPPLKNKKYILTGWLYLPIEIPQIPHE